MDANINPGQYVSSYQINVYIELIVVEIYGHFNLTPVNDIRILFYSSQPGGIVFISIH